MQQQTNNVLRQGLERYFTQEERTRLGMARVGIAGTGGLGSNVALMLARSGIENFILIDHDTVDASNLNRQYFFPQHVGMTKVDAVESILMMLNPHICVEKLHTQLDATNIAQILPKCPYWIEALDSAQCKRLFVEQALIQERFTVSASGMAGIGGPPMQKKWLGKYLILVGDFTSSIDSMPPFAPRVIQAAAMQADAMLEHILSAV